MSCQELKTYQWQCDTCGQKTISQGFTEEDSKPLEFGKRQTDNRGLTNYYASIKDVCVNCWDSVPDEEKFKIPAILLPVKLKSV